MTDSSGSTTEPTTATGRCDCGGVSYEITGALRDVYNCHCERCRRITGHHMAATAVAPEQITMRADATLRWYDPVPSVHYGFCGTCGSTLFWKVRTTNAFSGIAPSFRWGEQGFYCEPRSMVRGGA